MSTETPLMSLYEAAKEGIDRVRKPIWANPLDHLKLDVIDGTPGPWTHLFCPFNKECNGRDPVDLLFFQMDYAAKEWAAYEGALPASEEYKTAQFRFSGSLTLPAAPTPGAKP